jgi:argininosuccinate lyase
MTKEPAVIISTLTAFLTAAIGFCLAFGLDISEEQQDAVIKMVAAMVTTIAVLGPVIRQFVFSPKTTQQLVNKAEEAGIKDAPAPVVQP